MSDILERAIVGSIIKSVSIGTDVIEFTLDTIILSISFNGIESEYCVNDECEELEIMVNEEITEVQIEDYAIALRTPSMRFKLISRQPISISVSTYVDYQEFSPLYGKIIDDIQCGDRWLKLVIEGFSIVFNIISNSDSAFVECYNVDDLLDTELTTLTVDSYGEEDITITINDVEIFIQPQNGDWLFIDYDREELVEQ